MTYGELLSEVPGWRAYASARIWPTEGPEGRPASWNTCEATTKLVLASLWDAGIYPEPERGYGVVLLDDPNLTSLREGHFWGVARVEDRPEDIIVDLTIGQTGSELPWVCDTQATLAARGIHYVTKSLTPYVNLAFA